MEKFGIFLFCLSLIISSCKKESKLPPKDKLEPSDYLYSQRAYPYGKIDLEAYQHAVSAKQSESSGQLQKRLAGEWISEGPYNLSGRITDVEMPADNSQKIYVGTASGGVFLSEDRGENWKPILDEAASLSIGDLAIDPQNSNRIWVGTGESNAGGGSLAYDGQGVYFSEDGGESWKDVGLKEVGSVGRVIVDKQDGDKVFVAAMGHLFESESSGGIYRTQNIGETWEQILFLSDSTGGIDVVQSADAEVLYAAMWERTRSVTNRKYGGITSGVHRSMDGGDTWQELTDGLPSAPLQMGRIALTVSHSDPEVIYAFYSSADGFIAGLYKSEDKGETWTTKSIDGINNVPYMWWFGRIQVDPKNDNLLYICSLNMFRSDDGGDSWYQTFVEDADGSAVHVDHQAIFIHPEDDYMMIGTDGGLYESTTSGDLVEYVSGIPNYQFYVCAIDPHDTEIIYGGTQDNGLVKSSDTEGLWIRIIGGDGTGVLLDSEDEDIIYLVTPYGRFSKSIDRGLSFDFAMEGLEGRGNWSMPIVADPNNANKIYTGTQSLFRSEDKAENWVEISTQLLTLTNVGNTPPYGTITTIDVSSIDSDLIYFGSDEGKCWVTTDGGQNYTNVSDGLPNRWITSIAHDPHNLAGVYVTVSGYRFGEFDGQIFYSDNFGADWQSIGGQLPDQPINKVLPDPAIGGQVYIATDLGVYVGKGKGADWSAMGEGLPLVPVLDIAMDPGSRKLVAATFGRGMYTYPDVPLEPSSVNVSEKEEPILFPNPANDFIKVNGHEEMDWNIFSVSGEYVKYVEADTEISISDLKEGSYLLISGQGGIVLPFQVVR